MSTVHSVSDITNILSTTIQDQPTLQDVWVHGEVSQKTSSQGYQHYFFMLENAKNGDKIECVIYKKNAHLFKVISTIQDDVVVKGRIVLFASKSEYRFAVESIETSRAGLKSKIVSVSDLANNLQTTLRAHSRKVRGKISNNSKPKHGFLHLHLKNSNADEGTDGEMVECQLPPSITNKLPFRLKKGDEVSVDGQFGIFLPMSRYQITAKSIQRARNTDSLEDEDKVATVVESYFSQFQGFSTARECEIQMGVDHRSADIVLIDEDGTFAAIAECKRNGVIGYGPAQLKSYLCATDTQFGVFANSADSDSWVFYENLRHNRFQQIECPEFEEGIVKGIVTRYRLPDEIEALESKFNQLENEISDLKIRKAEIAQEVGQESQELDMLKQTIESDRAHNQDLKSIQEHLSNEIDRLRANKTELQTEIEKLERKESRLHASRKQWEEKIQQFETFLADLKSGLLDSEPLPQSEDNVDPQRTRGQEKQSIVSKLKNLFSKEKT